MTVPQGWWGTVFPGVGNDKGRGGGGVLRILQCNNLVCRFGRAQWVEDTFQCHNLQEVYMQKCGGLQRQGTKGARSVQCAHSAVAVQLFGCLPVLETHTL